MSLRLGLFFNMSAGFWFNLQKDYELRIAQRENLAKFEKIVRPFKAARL
jgi:plasmid maintenance system antidote protein VapI